MHKIGDIVLMPFPFTDLSGNKVRPALILGVQNGGDDLTVCFISSVIPKKIPVFDIPVDSKGKNFRETGLKLKSIVRTTKIATLDKAIVLGKIGNLDMISMNKVRKALKIYLGL